MRKLHPAIRISIWLGVLLLFGGLTWLGREEYCYERMQTIASQVELAVEREAAYSGSGYLYRLDLLDLVGRGFLEDIPTNPYTGQPVKVLAEADPPQVGCLMYLVPGPPNRTTDGTGGPWKPPSAIFQDYFLIALGDGYRCRVERQIEDHIWVGGGVLVGGASGHSSAVKQDEWTWRLPSMPQVAAARGTGFVPHPIIARTHEGSKSQVIDPAIFDPNITARRALAQKNYAEMVEKLKHPGRKPAPQPKPVGPQITQL